MFGKASGLLPPAEEEEEEENADSLLCLQEHQGDIIIPKNFDADRLSILCSQLFSICSISNSPSN